MDLTVLASAAAISVGVSGIATFTFQTLLKAAIERRFNLELENVRNQNRLMIERLKTELLLTANTEREMTERRMKAYPALVSLVYRLRNMARDFSAKIGIGNLSLVDEFGARTRELEEALYGFRIDLERDALFGELHRFKNLAINFNIRAADVKYFLDKGEKERAHIAGRELIQLYEQLDGAHLPVINNLSAAHRKTQQD